MNLSQKFFLSVLSDFINDRTTSTIPEELDWPLLYKYARSHQVQGILYRQCKEYLRKEKSLSEINQRLQSEYALSLFHHKQIDAAYQKIGEAFCHKSLKFFTVKGYSLAGFYPVPALRTMGDIDMILSDEDRLTAHETMLEAGYSNTGQGTAEWAYFKNDIEIELHNQLEYDLLSKHAAFFNHYHKYVTLQDGKYVLDISFHFLYLILHLRKHLMYSGAGFRQFMDLAILIQARGELLDWKWITDHLEQYDLYDFASICLTLCHRWFGTEISMSCGKLEEHTYEILTKGIFRNGVFGFHNKENLDFTVNHLAKRNALGHGSARGLTFKNALSHVFPSYRNMCIPEHYAFLRGRPYLLPFVWVYRGFRGIKKHQAGAMASDIHKTFHSVDEIEKRTKWLKLWGINRDDSAELPAGTTERK